MTLLTDPAVWASFLSLSALEIVLGVDNLVFIALLAGRLPPEQRSQARMLGLGLALGTRLLLLASIAWLAALTDPVVSLGGFSFSWRDLVLLAGGAFLLFKGTREIHLQVDGVETERPRAGAGLVSSARSSRSRCSTWSSHWTASSRRSARSTISGS